MKHYTIICNISKRETKCMAKGSFMGERYYVPSLRDAPPSIKTVREAMAAGWEPYKCDCYVRLASTMDGDKVFHYYFYDLVTVTQANNFLVGNGII